MSRSCIYGLQAMMTDQRRKNAWEKGNLINANCALAAPPHYPPLVEPLRPGPTLVPHSLSNSLTNLLSVSPTPARTLTSLVVYLSESAAAQLSCCVGLRCGCGLFGGCDKSRTDPMQNPQPPLPETTVP